MNERRDTTDLRVESILADGFAKAYGLDREPDDDYEPDEEEDDAEDD